MSGMYELLAPFYDRLNGGLDYESWADYVETNFSRFPGRVQDVLDLGCGTGNSTLPLARRGYGMIGVDASAGMLSVAQRRAAKEGLSILWLQQDMRAFELYGTVEAVTCCLDGVNHLLTPSDLAACFALVHNYLVPGGLFFFDVNSPYKFAHVFGDNAYILEEGKVLCAWQNCYRKEAKLCDFYISLFREEKDGRYTRTDTIQQERMYTPLALQRALHAAGMELLAVHGDLAGNPPTEQTERLYYIARAVK